MNIEKNEKLLADMSQRKKLSKDEVSSQFILKNSLKLDKQEIESTDEEYKEYLHLAMENYIKCLQLESDSNFDSSIVFRLFALLFSNKTNTAIINLLSNEYSSIATYKFVAIMPQITTYLSNNGDEFSVLVENIIRKLRENVEYVH